MTNFITSETQNQEKQGGGNNLDCASVMGFSLNKEKKRRGKEHGLLLETDWKSSFHLLLWLVSSHKSQEPDK